MHHAMRRSIALLSLTTVAILGACGSDSTAPNPNSSSVGGNWTLRTINSNPLPYLLQSGSTKVNILSSTLTISDGGTWSENANGSVSLDGGPFTNQVLAVSGGYVRAGQTLALTESNGAAYLTCNFDGHNTLTCQGGILAYV